MKDKLSDQSYLTMGSVVEPLPRMADWLYELLKDYFAKETEAVNHGTYFANRESCDELRANFLAEKKKREPRAPNPAMIREAAAADKARELNTGITADADALALYLTDVVEPSIETDDFLYSITGKKAVQKPVQKPVQYGRRSVNQPAKAGPATREEIIQFRDRVIRRMGFGEINEKKRFIKDIQAVIDRS